MNKENKKFCIKALAAAAALLFLISPLFPFVRSLLVMQIWNQVQKSGSLLEDTASVKIPGGGFGKEAKWYPFVMNYNADSEFSTWMGEPGIRLSIYYNFPAFSMEKGCSRLYDPESPYYNSFYGAYLVQRENGTPFGFLSDGKLNPEEIAMVPRFDYSYLVLGNFGCKSSEFVFDWDITSQTENAVMVGTGGWTVCEADVLVSGSAHKQRKMAMSYLQYGEPGFFAEEDFAPTAMKGILYARYFPIYKVSLFFYVIGGNEEVCRNCVEEILAKSQIEWK